eukprot:13987-Hanusia_phi.AAC.1
MPGRAFCASSKVGVPILHPHQPRRRLVKMSSRGWDKSSTSSTFIGCIRGSALGHRCSAVLI